MGDAITVHTRVWFQNKTIIRVTRFAAIKPSCFQHFPLGQIGPLLAYATFGLLAL